MRLPLTTSPTPTPYRIALTGPLWPDNLDKQLQAQPAMPKGLTEVQLDLADVSYITIHSLLLLLALISRHNKKGRKLVIRLPKRDVVAEFLVAWEFLEAVEEVLRVDRSAFLASVDEVRAPKLSRAANNRYVRGIVSPDGVMQRLYSSRFFSLQTFRRQPLLFNEALAVDITKTWREAMVDRVLQRMLSKGPELFRSRVVFEAVMNSIRHPNASLIQTASAADARVSHYSRQRYFAISFWDDGALISATLRRALKRGLPIRGAAFGSVDAEYWVYSGKHCHVEHIRAFDLPDSSSHGERLLLASIFPGVSCDPTGATRREDIATPPGMGLYYLANAAVTVFGGRVIVRSGKHYLRVARSERKSSDSSEAFAVRLRTLAAGSWIDGNLLSVEIPIETKELARAGSLGR